VRALPPRRGPPLTHACARSPTEATIGCTARVVRARDRKENIGRPLGACAAYVVLPAPAPAALAALQPVPDRAAPLALAPRGTPGELVVAGPLVGAGYHGLPAATRRAFLDWPAPGARAYRTGDLGALSRRRPADAER
jgi:non-ribosomal peptide synthetase component F